MKRAIYATIGLLLLLSGLTGLLSCKKDCAKLLPDLSGRLLNMNTTSMFYGEPITLFLILSNDIPSKSSLAVACCSAAVASTSRLEIAYSEKESGPFTVVHSSERQEPPLECGEHRNLQPEIIFNKEGFYVVQVIFDSGNVIEESNELNNTVFLNCGDDSSGGEQIDVDFRSGEAFNDRFYPAIQVVGKSVNANDPNGRKPHVQISGW